MDIPQTHRVNRISGNNEFVTISSPVISFKKERKGRLINKNDNGLGIVFPAMLPSVTSVTSTTFESKDKSNCPELKSVTSIIATVTTKDSPSSTSSGALTRTSTSSPAAAGITARNLIERSKTYAIAHFNVLFLLLLFPFTFYLFPPFTIV